MLRMPSLLESRNCLLHLWTFLERQWSQPTFSSMAIGRFLNRELCHLEGATSWCSARQNWGTERAFHCPQCAKEMSQKEIWRNSRSFPKTSNISWFATQNWLDWGDVHCDGQISTGKPLLLSIAWRVRKISEKWYITLNKSGRNAPMKLRSDFREALTNMHRLHRESGEERPEPIPFLSMSKVAFSSSSSSSTLWWQWNEHWWRS